MSEVGLSKRDKFTNMNMIIALINAFSLVAQFSICLLEVLNSILEMPNFTTFDKRYWRYVVKTCRSYLYHPEGHLV